MVVVKRGKSDTSESVWRKFGKINYEENLVDELRNRKYYKKPSIVRKEEEKLRRKSRGRRVVSTRLGRPGSRTGTVSRGATRK